MSLDLPHEVIFSWPMRFATFLMILIINALRVPSGLLNFWAEDGVVFYSDVINEKFPNRLFIDSGKGGYLNLSGKIIAEFVGLFPIAVAPIINFIFVNLFYSIILWVIYSRLKVNFVNRTYLYLLMGFFVFVPAATFDSVATSINLHFFLLFACFLIIITVDTKTTFIEHLLIVLTILSDPLAILLIPAVLLRTFLTRRFESYLLTFVLSTLAQIIFVIHFFGSSVRVIGATPDLIKVAYLFMDRVVGSSFIPFWGHIDGQFSQTEEISKILLLRLGVSFIVLSLFIYIIVRAFSFNLKSFASQRGVLVQIMVVTLCLYWATAGLFFNPEPRYAIFPSLCLATILLSSLDMIAINTLSLRRKKVLVCTSMMLFLALSLGAFQESEIRHTNLKWGAQLHEAKGACKSDLVEKASIQIPPLKNNLNLFLNCKLLNR